MEINQNGIQVSTGSIPKKKQSTLKGRDLSGAIIQIADDHSAAVSRKDFQAKLNQIKNLSNEELVKFVKNFKEESIIEVICDEVGSSKDEKEKACETVINTLVSRAKSLGYKTDYLQINISGLIINTDRLDNIVNTLTKVIESRSKLTSKEINAINSRPEKTNRTKANTKIIERYNKAVRSFNTRVKDDGWAGITADAIGKIYGSKNTKEKVNNDLKVVLKQIGELKDANKKGDAAYKAKFKEVFGVEYDPVNIELFEKTEKKYLAAASAHEFETSFNSSCRVLLRNAPLREEHTQRCIDPQANIYVTDTVSKIQVYNREYDNLAKFINKEDIDEVLNKAGVSNKSIDEKFEVLKKLAQEISKNAKAKTKNCCGKESFEQVQAGYEYAYKAAYGNNDIQKRVNDYCTSQLIGAEVVKAGATIAASVVATFTGVGLVGVAAITAGTSVVANVSDKATTENVREVYKKEGLKAATEKVIDDVDWEATLKQAVISGGAVLIGGSVAKGVSVVMEGTKPAAQAIAQFGGDIVCDAGMEYLTTGKITVEGMVFAVLLSAAGNIVAMKQLSAAADAAKNADETIVPLKLADDGIELTKVGEFNPYNKIEGNCEFNVDGQTVKVFADWEDCYIFSNKDRVMEHFNQVWQTFKTSEMDLDTYLKTANIREIDKEFLQGVRKVKNIDVAFVRPESLLKPQTADNIAGKGISFKQAAGQPDYSATRIEWGRTVEETIALNKKNGVNLELVKGDDGQYFLGIKDIWTDGYHRVDRNSVVMHYGDYAPTPENYVAANPEWAKANANPDGTVKDCAVVANDTGAKILENSYVTVDGQKIDFATMAPGTKVHKDPNAIVNAVAYDSPKTLHTLEGDITTDITMGDVDGNVYNNFKQLKKQITKGQLVANEADPYSARFIELVKAGQDDEAIALLKSVTKMSQ
jgi:hypothetical protein